MTEVEVYVLANNQLNKVIQQIKDDQWNLPIPEWFQVGRAQGDMTLRTIINYHAYDDIWVSDTLAGKTIAEVGDKYDGDLLGDDPKAKFAEITERGIVRMAISRHANISNTSLAFVASGLMTSPN
jgi:hypothetical protein